jgi:hypothetical protein
MKLSELKSDSRGNFNDTWLLEMPSGAGTFETFDTLEYSIKDFLKHGIKPVDLGNGLKKIVSDDKYFYWFDKFDDIVLAVELYKKAEGLVVSLVGKNRKYKGKQPHASQLYSAILKDTDKSLRILSDTQLSDEGFSLWKKMLALGHKISVYDNKDPGKTFKSFEIEKEMEQYFKDDDTDFLRYQYILSENVLDYCTVRASFRLRLHREKSNIL